MNSFGSFRIVLLSFFYLWSLIADVTLFQIFIKRWIFLLFDCNFSNLIDKYFSSSVLLILTWVNLIANKVVRELDKPIRKCEKLTTLAPAKLTNGDHVACGSVWATEVAFFCFASPSHSYSWAYRYARASESRKKLK